jgi:hypothetical protein
MIHPSWKLEGVGVTLWGVTPIGDECTYSPKL